MKCNCCNNFMYTSLERFGAPDAPLCILCWMKGRERSWVFGGPTTFSRFDQAQVYAEVMGRAQLPLFETPEGKAA
jgi:hypothetical protein